MPLCPEREPNLRLTACLALALIFSPATKAETEIGWQRLQFEGKQFIGKITLAVEVVYQPRQTAVSRMAALSEQALLPKNTVAVVSRETVYGNRKQVQHNWLDIDQGYRLLQKTRIELGGKSSHRIDRYQVGGFTRLRREPARGERSLPPEQWRVSSWSERALPASLRQYPVTSLDALFYLIAVSNIQRTGEETTFYISQDERGFRVRLTAKAFTQAALNFQQIGDDTGQIKTTKKVLMVGLAIQALDAKNTDTPSLLGLRKVEILFDPETRTVVGLSGQGRFRRVMLQLKTLHKRPISSAFNH